MDDVANKILAGISKAQKDYEDWTGGYWLWEAPEYMGLPMTLVLPTRQSNREWV